MDHRGQMLTIVEPEVCPLQKQKWVLEQQLPEMEELHNTEH